MDYDREKKTERIWLRVGPAMKADLEKCAAKERREVSEYVRMKLERMLRARERGRA